MEKFVGRPNSSSRHRPTTPPLEESNFICEICDHVLIDTVSAACKHTFCTYCLYMWKKHDGSCPTCAKDLGKISFRKDVDTYINVFFASANPLAQEERKLFIQSRSASAKNIHDLPKVLFGPNPCKSGSSSSLLGQRSRAGTRNNTPLPSSRNTNSKTKEQLQKLNKETKKLESELKETYARIMKVSESIGLEEEALAPLYLEPRSPAGQSIAKSIRRPVSAVGTHGRLASKLLPRFNDQSEVDDLLEQATEMIRIENFMKVYSFENLKNLEDLRMDSDFAQTIHARALEDFEKLRIDGMGDSNMKRGNKTQNPKLPATTTPIHPNVKAFMKKNNIRTKVIVPIAPKEDEDEDEDDALEEEFMSGAQLNLNAPMTAAESQSVAELHECRMSLMKIRQRYTSTDLEMEPNHSSVNLLKSIRSTPMTSREMTRSTTTSTRKTGSEQAMKSKRERKTYPIASSSSRR